MSFSGKATKVRRRIEALCVMSPGSRRTKMPSPNGPFGGMVGPGHEPLGISPGKGQTHRSAPAEWRELQLADAAAHAQKVNEKGLISWRLPRSIRWTILLLLLGASLGFVPEYRSRAYAQKQKEQDNMREVGKQIAELTRRSLDRHPPALAPVEKAMGSIVELGDELSKAKLSRTEALREVAKVTDRLQETANELKQNPALKNLEQARRSPTGGTSPA